MWFLIWLIPLSLLILLLLWLLFAPIQLRVDTVNNRYEAGIWGLIKFWVEYKEGKIRFRLRVLFFEVNMKRGKKKKSKKDRPKKKKRRRPKMKTMLRIARAAFGSIKVKEFTIAIDTDDYTWNARLWPLVPVLHRWGIHLDVNYQGRNDLVLWVRTYAGKIGFRIIKAYLTRKRTSNNSTKT